MGKHKIVKSAAAVALTASVVATAVAPGASAASYKTNSKDQLVYSKSGKLVKGWKVFGGKLYKNGKLAPAKKYKIIGTGAAQQLFYGPTLKKGYKTATNKTLLFKDGKLADGWKQAGKNERLYKNGKLDKGYTVYTNVEGDKFLYHNGYLKKGQKTATRGGETLLFVDGKLAKGYVLHEASKTLYNNGKVAQGLVQYPEKDGKFYNNGKLANGEINGAEYKDGVLVAKDIASVKAINDTTVEVTFKKDQKDVKASDFKIEGLEVKNAATKQGDDKIVILTTSKQEAGKEYTLVHKEADTKTFTAKSEVIPTAISTSTASVQGTVGKEVTLKAQVTVAEGQSKAGIPVTFNIDGANNSLNKDIVAEAYTDENGVATYSYTQYNTAEDNVAIYATGKPADRALATVYWAKQDILTIVENDTKGSTVANGESKQYKVTYLNAKTGEPIVGANLNVTFAENIGITADKISSATIKDQLTGKTGKPYQLADGNYSAVKVKTDAKGQAIFTVSGTNTKVTPIVFADTNVNASNTVTGNGKVEATELQAQAAAAVTFQGAQVAHQLTLTPTFEDNYTAVGPNNGREYTLKVVDKDGKPYAGGTINLAFNEKLDKNNTTNTDAVFATVKGYENALSLVVGKDAQNQIKLDKNGVAKFKVTSTDKGYATPIAWLDQDDDVNNQVGTLDENEPKIVGAITYFQDSLVTASKLTLTNGSTTVTNGKALAGETVKFAYDATNQSGTVVTDVKKKVTYTITNTGSEAVTYTTATDNAEKPIKVGGKATVTVTTPPTSTSTNYDNFVTVTSKAPNASDVKVEATGYALDTKLVDGTIADKFLGTKTGTIEFTPVLTKQDIALAAIHKAGSAQTTIEYAATYNDAAKLPDTANNVDIVKDSNIDAVRTAVKAVFDKAAAENKTVDDAQIISAIKEAVKTKDAADAAANAQAVADDKAALTTSKTISANGSETLPTKGTNGSTITWDEVTDASNVAALNTAKDEVTFTRSNADDTDDTVVLKATIKKGDATDTQTVTYTVKEAKAPTATLPAITGVSSNDDTTLVATFDEALYNGNTAIADGADVKALFTYDGTSANYLSATYNATNKTVTFVFDGANSTPAPAENGKKLSAVNTLKDAAGNVVTDVYTYATLGTIWTK